MSRERAERAKEVGGGLEHGLTRIDADLQCAVCGQTHPVDGSELGWGVGGTDNGDAAIGVVRTLWVEPDEVAAIAESGHASQARDRALDSHRPVGAVGVAEGKRSAAGHVNRRGTAQGQQT